MASLGWGGAAILTLAGALFFWGAQVLEVENFYVDSCVLLGLALVLAGLAQI
jgi:ABC-type branched-subunit amino acid transport system permease subunit